MKKNVFIIFAAAVIFGSFFAFCFPHPLDRGDTVDYDTIGWNIAQGRGFSLSAKAPFAPTMFREPVYPYFLGAVYRIFGHSYNVVRFFQVILFGLTAVTVFLAARAVFDEKTAKYSGLFTALCPTLANYPSYILSETLFVFIAVALVLSLVYAVKKGFYRWFIVSALFSAMAVLCKASMVFFPVAAACVLLLLKTDVKRVAIFFILFAAVVSPWSLRNKILFGTPSVSLRAGIALWDRAEKLDYGPTEAGAQVVYNFSEYLGRKFFPGAGIEGENFTMQGSKEANMKFDELVGLGMSQAAADNYMKKASLAKIKSAPFKYAAQCPVEFMKMLSFLYVPMLNEYHVIEFFDKTPGGGIIIAAARAVFRILSYLVFLAAVFGMYLKRGSIKSWIFLLLIIVYINGINSLVFGFGRYAVPLIPFYLMFAVYYIRQARHGF